MTNEQPILDPATHYRIEVRGRVDTEWLQSFDNLSEIIADEPVPAEDTTAIHVHTDQSGIIGLLRSLHSMGMTILQLQIVSRKEEE